MTSKTWTKESLKSLARVDTTRKKESSSNLPDDVSQLKRKVNVRAVPKLLFSALLLATPFGMVYLFASGNLGSSSGAGVNAQEVDPETKQLQEELEASRRRNDELAAKLAMVKQEKSHPVTEVEEIPVATSEVTKPIASKPVAQPLPPKQIVRRRVVSPQRTPPPKRTVAPPQQPTIPVAVVPSVFGAASSKDVQHQKTEVAGATPARPNSGVAKPVSYSTPLLPQKVNSFQIANNFPTPTINPELEASLLQEQPSIILRTGASTKANLAVPWVQDLGGRRAESIISVVLTEPLRGAARRIYLPAQTTVFVKAEYLGQPDIIEFVAVEAQLPTSTDGSARKITLPEGVIRFSDENGQPLVALPVRNKTRKSEGRDFFEILDSAEGVWRISNQVGLGNSDDVVGEVLRGQRQIRSRLGQRNRYPSYQSRSQQIVYLPEGTKLKLYINQEVTVPSVSN